MDANQPIIIPTTGYGVTGNDQLLMLQNQATTERDPRTKAYLNDLIAGLNTGTVGTSRLDMPATLKDDFWSTERFFSDMKKMMGSSGAGYDDNGAALPPLPPGGSTAGAGSGNAAPAAATTCDTFDIPCYVSKYGTSLIAIIVGIVLVIGAIFLYRG